MGKIASVHASSSDYAARIGGIILGTWTSPAQVPHPPSFSPHQPIGEEQLRVMHKYIKDLANVLSSLRNDLEYMINGHLDVKNIRAKGIKAQNIDVDELSAITANLGHIISGLIESVQIFGSYIATANGTYPRVELSSVGNFLAALASATNSLSVVPSSGGVPALVFQNSSFGAVMQIISNQLQFLSTFGTNLAIGASGGTLSLSGSSVTISTGTTRTVYVATTPGGPADSPLVITSGVCTS